MTGAALDRTSAHSELMDGIYRRQRHIYDATRKYYLLGRDRMISGLALKTGESLLEIGCGTGRNLARARALFPDARLYGLDISAEMLASARKSLAGLLASPEDLRLLDAASFSPADFAVTGFDRIMISYALSMIPDWQGTIRQALAALKPRGSLHIVDFGQQRDLPRWFHRLLTAWLRKFHVTPRDDLRSVLEGMIADGAYSLEFVAHQRDYAWILVVRRR